MLLQLTAASVHHLNCPQTGLANWVQEQIMPMSLPKASVWQVLLGRTKSMLCGGCGPSCSNQGRLTQPKQITGFSRQFATPTAHLLYLNSAETLHAVAAPTVGIDIRHPVTAVLVPRGSVGQQLQQSLSHLIRIGRVHQYTIAEGVDNVNRTAIGGGHDWYTVGCCLNQSQAKGLL
jgi:hypothetical protein